MATVVRGRRGTNEQPYTHKRPPSGVEVHAAQLTCAEAAIAGGWEDELGDVLDVLGIRWPES